MNYSKCVGRKAKKHRGNTASFLFSTAYYYVLSSKGGLIMPYIERTDEEIIAAWGRYLERHSDPDTKMLGFFGTGLLSIREIVGRLRGGDQDFRVVFIETVRKDAREKDEDPIERINKGRQQNTTAKS